MFRNHRLLKKGKTNIDYNGSLRGTTNIDYNGSFRGKTDIDYNGSLRAFCTIR